MTKRNRVQTLDKARHALLEAHKSLGTWRAVALKFGIPAGTACAVAKGREPKSAAIRKALGLPVLGQGRICPIHGVVHDRQCREQKQASQKKPRRNWKQAALTFAGLLSRRVK